MTRPTTTSILGIAAGTAAAITAGLTASLAGFSYLVARRSEMAVPPLGRFVTIDGQRIHYIDDGAPARPGLPTIVMVHGLGGNARNFTHSLVGLLRDEFRCVVIDRPGSGYSTRPRGRSANVRAQAWVIRDTIAALAIERPLLVGHSLGGAVSLATAIDHPDSVGGLALLAPLTQVQHPDGSFKRLAIASPWRRTLIAWTLAIPMSIRTRTQVLDMVFGPEPVARAFAVDGGGLLGARPKAFESVSTDLVALNRDMPAIVARYGEIRVPVSVLFGTGDRVLGHEKHGAALVDLIPDLVFDTIEGAGHMIPLTQTRRCAALIRGVAERMEERARG